MPELPEVETVARNLREKIHGRVIEKVLICRSSVLKSRPEVLQKELPGLKIREVVRRGKYLGFQSSEKLALWFHLGMTGQLVWSNEWNEREPHLHFVLRFQGLDQALVFRDIRRFGKIFLTREKEAGSPRGFLKLGAEPLEILKDSFIALYKQRKAVIKTLLLNQELVAGIGNIYADESLFRAGIHPRRRAWKLTSERLTKLHAAVQSTLQSAIDHGGSTIDDFIHADGLNKGSFQKFHKVYGKNGKPCTVCGTKIQRIVLGGRSSFFCSHCQK